MKSISRLVQAQVDGQSRLVLAAPGAGHIGLGEGQAILRQGAVPDGLLLGPGPPAADRYDAAFHPSMAAMQAVQGLGGPALQLERRVAPSTVTRSGWGRGWQGWWALTRMRSPLVHRFRGQNASDHGAITCPRMVSKISGKEKPAAFIMPGNRLCAVKPGMVLTSLNTICPSGVRKQVHPGKAPAVQGPVDGLGGLLHSPGGARERSGRGRGWRRSSGCTSP